MQGQLIRQGTLDRNWKIIHPVVTVGEGDFGATGGIGPSGYNDVGFILDVDPTRKLRTKWFAQANNATFTIHFKGFYRDGMGQRIADVLCTAGNVNHNTAGNVINTMQASVRKEFVDMGASAFECDTYAITAHEAGIVAAIVKVDDNSVLDLDFTNQGYAQIVAAIELNGGAPATKAMGIYIPVF